MSHMNEGSWSVVTVRLPPELITAIEQYGESVGETVMSLMVRSLISAGLQAKGRGKHHVERTLIANAKAAAVKRMSDLQMAAMEAFWDLETLTKEDEGEDEEVDEDEDEDEDEE